MTPEELTHLAVQCGFGAMHLPDGRLRFLQAFEAAIRADEREACFLSLVAMADACETRGVKWSILWSAAEAIRARGAE